ncbi:MAG: bifunctional riboflavin kinase/FAD synthetase [Gemmatirosa sp.]|nr:bifunctional riboflavin kinase/FAD synthetase [Gemmatirosa sp.]
MPASGLPPDVIGTIVTVGTFDGVHLGHQDVVARLTERAAATGLRSVLVTFEPHPLTVVNPAIAPPLLTPGREKLDALAESGLDYVAVLPFTQTLARYEADQFVDIVLCERLRMRELLIGHDHGFGRGRSGDATVLQSLGADRGFRVEIVPPVAGEGGAPVSSSAIRRALSDGDLGAARRALGRRYGVSGTVVHGEQRGRLLGYRTINVRPESDRKLLPALGVYAVLAQTPSGAFGGMMNLGGRPTFGDERISLEAHLFDADVDLYGAHVRLDFVARLRDVRKFDSVDDLVAQLGRDAESARRALGDDPPRADRGTSPTVV